jgi:hypothetical protein
MSHLLIESKDVTFLESKKKFVNLLSTFLLNRISNFNNRSLKISQFKPVII